MAVKLYLRNTNVTETNRTVKHYIAHVCFSKFSEDFVKFLTHQRRQQLAQFVHKQILYIASSVTRTIQTPVALMGRNSGCPQLSLACDRAWWRFPRREIAEKKVRNMQAVTTITATSI